VSFARCCALVALVMRGACRHLQARVLAPVQRCGSVKPARLSWVGGTIVGYSLSMVP
jgi:hypothetical protein